jgi:hypothetical protein
MKQFICTPFSYSIKKDDCWINSYLWKNKFILYLKQWEMIWKSCIHVSISVYNPCTKLILHHMTKFLHHMTMYIYLCIYFWFLHFNITVHVYGIRYSFHYWLEFESGIKHHKSKPIMCKNLREILQINHWYALLEMEF